MLALLILSSPPRSFFKACQKLHQIVFFIQSKVFPLGSQASFFFLWHTLTNQLDHPSNILDCLSLSSLSLPQERLLLTVHLHFFLELLKSKMYTIYVLVHSAMYLVLMWWELYFRCWKHCLENNFQSKDERYDHCFLCVSGWFGLPFLLEHIQMIGRFLYSRFGCFTSYRSKEMFTSSCG